MRCYLGIVMTKSEWTSDWSRVEIKYAAEPNLNTYKGGWVPVIWNGEKKSGGWMSVGLDKDEALAAAAEWAAEEAARYVGDWVVTVTEVK